MFILNRYIQAEPRFLINKKYKKGSNNDGTKKNRKSGESYPPVHRERKRERG